MKKIYFQKFLENKPYVPLLNGNETIGSVEFEHQSINKLPQADYDLVKLLSYIVEENLLSKTFMQELTALLQSIEVPSNYIVPLLESTILLSEDVTFELNKENVENLLSAFLALYPSPYERFLELVSKPSSINTKGEHLRVLMTNKFNEFKALDEDQTYTGFSLKIEDMATGSKINVLTETLEEQNNKIMRKQGDSTDATNQDDNANPQEQSNGFSESLKKEGEQAEQQTEQQAEPQQAEQQAGKEEQVQEEPVQVEPVQVESLQDESLQDKPVQDEPLRDEPLVEPVRHETESEDETSEDELLDESLEDESLEDESSEDELSDESLEDESLEDESLEDESLEDESPIETKNEDEEVKDTMNENNKTGDEIIGSHNLPTEPFTSTPLNVTASDIGLDAPPLPELPSNLDDLKSETNEDVESTTETTSNLDKTQAADLMRAMNESVGVTPDDIQSSVEMPIVEGSVEDLFANSKLPQTQEQEQPAQEEQAEQVEQELEQEEQELEQEEQAQPVEPAEPVSQPVEPVSQPVKKPQNKEFSNAFSSSQNGQFIKGKAESTDEKIKAAEDLMKDESNSNKAVQTAINKDELHEALKSNETSLPEPTNNAEPIESVNQEQPETKSTQQTQIVPEVNHLAKKNPNVNFVVKDEQENKPVQSTAPTYKELSETIKEVSQNWEKVLNETKERHQFEIAQIESQHQIDLVRQRETLSEEKETSERTLKAKIQELELQVKTLSKNTSNNNNQVIQELNNQLSNNQLAFDEERQQLLERIRELEENVNNSLSELSKFKSEEASSKPIQHLPVKQVKEIQRYQESTKNFLNAPTQGNVSLKQFYGIKQEDNVFPKHGVTGVIIKPTKG